MLVFENISLHYDHSHSNTNRYFARSYDLKLATIGDRLRAVRPSMFLGVPRVWEKISEKMKSMVAKNPLTGLKLKLALWAKKLGLEHQTNCQLGGSGSKGFGYPIAKKLILDTVKRKLGLDRCKFAFTGAAPITTETLSYFGALGIQINEVYVVSNSQYNLGNIRTPTHKQIRNERVLRCHDVVHGRGTRVGKLRLVHARYGSQGVQSR